MKLFEQSVRDEGHSSVEVAVQGNTEFALDLYQKLRTTEGNLFFSPYSISTALAMTYAGARGDTEVQIAQALHFLLDRKQLHPAFALLEAKLGEVGKKGHVQLRVANTLWPQKGYAFLKEFLALTKQYYGVLITPIEGWTSQDSPRLHRSAEGKKAGSVN
jgi:serpin B